MRKFTLRVRLALWAFRNPDRLTMLHFEMLRDAGIYNERAYHARCRNALADEALNLGRACMAERVRMLLSDMPGARENEAAL